MGRVALGSMESRRSSRGRKGRRRRNRGRRRRRRTIASSTIVLRRGFEVEVAIGELRMLSIFSIFT